MDTRFTLYGPFHTANSAPPGFFSPRRDTPIIIRAASPKPVIVVGPQHTPSLYPRSKPVSISPVQPSRRLCGCNCRSNCACNCSCKCSCLCKGNCEGSCEQSPKQFRNLVVSIDGTSNQFGVNVLSLSSSRRFISHLSPSWQNTNVVELHSRIIKDRSVPQQITYYNSGIGTYVPPSFRSFSYWKQVLGNKIDLAIAW